MRVKVSARGVHVTGYYKICTVPARPPAEIIEGKRPSARELKAQEQARSKLKQGVTKCFWLPQHLAGVDNLDTWPMELRHLPTKLSLYPSSSLSTVIAALEQTYPKDPVLVDLATFLRAAQQDHPDPKFTDQYKHVFIPRNTAGRPTFL